MEGQQQKRQPAAAGEGTTMQPQTSVLHTPAAAAESVSVNPPISTDGDVTSMSVETWKGSGPLAGNSSPSPSIHYTSVPMAATSVAANAPPSQVSTTVAVSQPPPPPLPSSSSSMTNGRGGVEVPSPPHDPFASAARTPAASTTTTPRRSYWSTPGRTAAAASSTTATTPGGASGGGGRRRWLSGRFGRSTSTGSAPSAAGGGSNKSSTTRHSNYGATASNDDTIGKQGPASSEISNRSNNNPMEAQHTTTTTLSSPLSTKNKGNRKTNPDRGNNRLAETLRNSLRNLQQRSAPPSTNHHHQSSNRTRLRPTAASQTLPSSTSMPAEVSVLARFESILRLLVLWTVSFFLGTCFSSYGDIARHAVGYTAVAYVTCLILLLAVRWEKARTSNPSNSLSRRHAPVVDGIVRDEDLEAMEEGTPLLLLDSATSQDESHIPFPPTTSNSSVLGGGEDQLLQQQQEPLEDMIHDGAARPRAATVHSICPPPYRPEHHRHQKSSGSNTPLLQYVPDPVDLPQPPPPLPPMPQSVSSPQTTAVSKRPPNQSSNSKALPKKPRFAHSSLKPLYVTDAMAEPVPSRVNVNNAQQIHVMDTEYFLGQLLILVRTPDMDDPNQPSLPENRTAMDFFRGKQRRFEMQFQGKLKRIPTGRVYYACELDQPFKLGMIQRAFVGAAMAFVKSSNPFFHYSITGDATTGEPPHMAFPLVEGMNSLVVTPPGQIPPKLGSMIQESAESQKSRKKGTTQIAWNLEDTYTFSIYTAYVDFLQWKCLNLPGIRPFTLSSVLGMQPINMVAYELDEKKKSSDSTVQGNRKGDGNASNRDKGPHIRRKDRTWFHLELCNDGITQLGPASQKVVQAAAESDDKQNQVDVDQFLAMNANGVNDQRGPTEEQIPLVEGPESPDETEEDEAAAELGEGIYVRSGDPIVLKEAVAIPAEESQALPSSIATTPSSSMTLTSGAASVVTIGGGFCLLQEQQTSQQPQSSASRIVIGVAKQARYRNSRGAAAGSSLIKNGDTVFFKLIKNDGTTLLLTIHRGWWLKWVAMAPNKNCYFTIHTHSLDDVEAAENKMDDEEEYDNPSPSYLRVGGTFWLQHRRWPKYAVGVSAEGSAAYGGRLMALYKHGSDGRPLGVPQQQTSDSKAGETLAPLSIPPLDDAGDGYSDEEDAGPDVVKAPSQWMNPLLFRAMEGVVSSGEERITRSSSLSNLSDDPALTEVPPRTKQRFSADETRMDAPAWIELMNRSKRVVHLAYVVRVVPPLISKVEEDPCSAFVRIRTGRDLAEVMRVGQNWRSKTRSIASVSPSAGRRRQRGEREDSSFPAVARSSGGESVSRKSIATTGEDEDEMRGAEVSLDDSDDSQDDADFFENDDEAEGADASSNDALQPHHRRRPGKLIGKLARSVKHRTSAVVKVGKGTVSAGKSMIPIRPKIPPMKEPNSKQVSSARSRRRTERELHKALSRGMKRMDRNESGNASISTELIPIMAGELSAPEQSCRTVSNMLIRMSSISRSSENNGSFNNLLNSQISFSSDHDVSFLRGTVLDLGVTPSKKHGEALAGYIVARCLWDGHWREEWCALYKQIIMFYAPLTDTPGLELSLADVQSFRLLDLGNASPLPGLPMLVLETAWQCYYIAFWNEELRRQFHEILDTAKTTFDKSVSGLQGEQDLWKARFWQGFHASFEASLSGGKGKWAEIVHAKRKKRRVVLNNRRMAFDLAPFSEQPVNFTETLLSWCLSFRLESLLEHPEALGRFLDATSQLQNFPLHDLDYMGPETFCIFVNLYHCLLQHALLLTVKGPLTKRSCGHFMRTNCYEIGGDVFSLAELQLCVIRGRMSRPVAPKAPFYDAPRKSQAFRHYYALGFTSPLVNFVMNTGNTMSPRQVAVFGLDNFYEQLSATAIAHVRKNVTVDDSRRIIYIPRVCDAFRFDFCDSVTNFPGWIHECLRFCLTLLEEEEDQALVSKIEAMLQQDHGVSVKFQPVSEQYHSTLQALSLAKLLSNNNSDHTSTNNNMGAGTAGPEDGAYTAVE